jgi:prevent-host-death family protein
MLEREPLPTITTSDLSRNPGRVLRRIERGERLVVCRKGKPLATLQPLDGFVFQPFEGTAHDVFGWPIGGIEEEAGKLSDLQRQLLLHGYRQWRIWPARVMDRAEWSLCIGALEEMRVRGLVTKTECGNELTGRGLALREALLRMERNA